MYMFFDRSLFCKLLGKTLAKKKLSAVCMRKFSHGNYGI